MRRGWPTLDVLALILFAISLALPALAILETPLLGGGPVDRELWGIVCLLSGFFVLPGWLANPLLGAAAIAHGTGRYRIATVLATCALASAVIAPFLLLESSSFRLRAPLAGYYCWAGSIALYLVACLDRAIRAASSRATTSMSAVARPDAPRAR